MWEDGVDQSLVHFFKSLKNEKISGEINRSGVMLEGVDEEGECRRRAWTGRWVSFQRSLNPAASSQTLLDILFSGLNIFSIDYLLSWACKIVKSISLF